MMNNSSWGKDTAFYRQAPWLNLRKAKIEQNPICELCESVGIVSEGTFIDHILNRLIFPELDLEPLNLQTLCTKCHAQKTGLEKRFKSKEAYLKAFESGRLQYVCRKEVKERLLKMLILERI
ncbi:HNH endonuclease [Belliella sp. DSM 111904]|uniref:HNH endonuclease n=1 Tax=Belliella filtrata TaxID=2923435 RepID=A0ABS9V414_9BACT|nr:HNH endonuclease signature motif containing protein [Belliella filtrata]MCH7411146.1 HNH endonuclease [Belliella filtrata]